MLSWAAVTARADSGATRARLWEHGSGACVQVIDDVGNADDLVYEFATYCIATPGRPTQHWVGGAPIEPSDAFLTSRHGDWNPTAWAREQIAVAMGVYED